MCYLLKVAIALISFELLHQNSFEPPFKLKIELQANVLDQTVNTLKVAFFKKCNAFFKSPRSPKNIPNHYLEPEI